jgi:hypothetical protein
MSSPSQIRSSLQSLPSLPSGREIAYDHHRISNYNEFQSGLINAEDDELEDGYDGEDEARNNNGQVLRGDIVDIQVNGYEGEIEMDDDDEDEDLEPNIMTEMPIELIDREQQQEDDDTSIHLEDEEDESSLTPFQRKSQRSKSMESNLSKLTNESMEIINLPIADDENLLSINQLLGNSYEKMNGIDDDNADEEFDPRKQGISPLHQEETESEWPGEEEQPTRQPAQPRRRKKHLTPAKKRRRCILAISLLVFCLGSAGAGVWFVFFYLEDKKGDSVYNQANVGTNDEGEEVPAIQPIGDMFDSDCAPLTVEVKTDGFGNETTWTLAYLLGEGSNIDQDDDVQYERSYSIKRKRIPHYYIASRRMQQTQELAVGSGGPYTYKDNSTQSAALPYNSTYCLTKGSYKFNIFDANGDGLCCNYGQGYYRLYFPRGREVRFSPFELGRDDGILFDVTNDDIAKAQETEAPSVSWMPSSSDVPSIAPSPNMSAVSVICISVLQ